MELVIYGDQPLMEVRQLDDLPHMRYSREKATLPFRKDERTKHALVPFMNTSRKEIARILNNEHPFIKHIGSVYRAYYYDFRSIRGIVVAGSGNIMPTTTIAEAKRARVQNYAEMDELVPGIKTPIALTTIQGKNVIYDLQPYIEQIIKHPKVKKFPLLRKLDVYFPTLENMTKKMESLATGYTVYPIMINLDEYKDQQSLNNYHFLTYLLALMKRSQDYIDRFKIDIDIILYTNKGYLYINMLEDINKQNLTRLKTGLKRLKPDMSVESVESKIEEEDVALRVNTELGVALTGNTEDLPISSNSEVVQQIIKMSDESAEADKEMYGKKVMTDDPDDLADSIEAVGKTPDEIEEEKDSEKLNYAMQEIEVNEELKHELVKTLSVHSSGGKERVVSERDKKLRARQQKIQMNGKTLEELTTEVVIPEVSKEVVSEDMAHTSVERMRNVRFANTNHTYQTELRDKDLAKTFTMYNDKSINVNVIDIKKEDTSDTMNMKETYTLTMEDEFRRRHTLKVNIPTFIDDNLLYMNGNYVTIQNQIAGLPVIKTGPDEVQICTNYNKIWNTRTGTKVNPNMERFKKFMIKDIEKDIKVSRGDNTDLNKGKMTCLEYDELAKLYNEVTIRDCHFIFSVDELHDKLDGKYESSLDKFLIGYRDIKGGKEPLWYDKNNDSDTDLITTMINYACPEHYAEFHRLTGGKKYIYTTSKMMEKWIPMCVVLCFFEGITEVVKKFNDKRVMFVDQKDRGDNYMYIPFKEGFLSYPISDTEACLLFNGFTTFDTSIYSVTDLDDRQTYIDIFETITGDGYIAGGIVNFYDFMMDPITVEICESLGYPTDIVSLMIYANNLLADNQYENDVSLKNYRNRRNEVVQAILYKQMAIAYSRYRATSRNNNPVKISLDPDCVIKNLQKVVTVGDYSKMGPICEIRDSSLASMRGYAGMNSDDAYKKDKRAYDRNTMGGVIGASTDNAKNCGKERHMVAEPNIANARGMYAMTDRKDVDSLEFDQLETAVELLNPGGLLHDDPVRTAMSSKQRGHAIPVRDGCPLLVSTGMDATIHYRTGDDYSVVARQDGEVIDKNDDLGLMIVQYKDGTKQAINLSVKMAKAGGEGMYLKNQLSTTYKKGDKFKKDAILAFDKFFYKDMNNMGNRLFFGTLVKSMIMSDPSTYEDSQWFTEKFSRKAATERTEKKTVIVGKNATIEFIRKVGEHVQVGDELMRFDTSFQDKELNKMLAGIRDDLQETIIDLGKTRISSKFDGTIEQILVYPGVPLDELSPSLKKVVNQYQSVDKKRQEYMNKIDPEHKNSVYRMGCFMNNPVGEVHPDTYGKIRGNNAEDAVVFEFYITVIDELSDGDKTVHQNANKATCGYMVPHGYEPFSEFRPYEEVSVIVDGSAILQRGTPSIIPTMLFYKALIELKRKHYEILTGENWNDKQKRENKYMVRSKSDKATESSDIVDDIPVFSYILESNGIMMTDRTCYSGKVYMPGDVIVDGLNKDGMTASDMADYMRGDGFIRNVKLDESNNQLIATEAIYPSEPLYT